MPVRTRNELRYYDRAQGLWNMYRYRTLTPEHKTEILRQRQSKNLPLHKPPHFHHAEGWFLITAATYEHKRHFQTEEDRAWLLDELLTELQVVGISISSWVVLPNHYHLLVQCQPPSVISQPLRRVHARTAQGLNHRESVSGRSLQ